MSNAIKFEDDYYIDTTGITHKRNALDKVIDELGTAERSVLTVSVNQSYCSTTAGSRIDFKSIYNQSGDTTKLLLDATNKGIKIGAGVSKVLVSAVVNANSSARKWFMLNKNTTKISDCLIQQTTPYSTGFFTPVLVDVSEGDILNVSNYEGTVSVNAGIANANGTLLTVEVIE